MAKSDAQKRADANYRKKMKQVVVAFSPNEMDLYEYLEARDNKAGFVKELIRQSMEREG